MNVHSLRSVAAALICFGVCTARAAAQSPYELNVATDGPLFGLGVAISFAGLTERTPSPSCAPSCPAGGINALDRTVVGYRSDLAGTVADFMLPAVLLLPVVLDGIDSQAHGWLTDTVVIAQSLILTQALTQLTKFAVRRPSPALYGGDSSIAAVHDIDATRSFFSAHTASAFAVTTAFTVTYWLRHPASSWRFVVLGVGAALSVAVGVLKVMAGAHFWTDVAAGAVVGASMGILDPLLHVAW